MKTLRLERLYVLAELALLLTGCTDRPEPTRSVSYYRENAEERQAMVARCADDPGSLGIQPNCVNAKRATAIEDIGSFKDLPPLGLTPPTETPGTEQKPRESPAR